MSSLQDLLGNFKNSNVMAFQAAQQLKQHGKETTFMSACDEERMSLISTLYFESTNTHESLKPKQTINEKSANLSEQFRVQGNKKFGQNSCSQALKAYNMSLSEAPAQSIQLAYGYANRSAVLFKMGHANEAIQDIDRAFESGYPKEQAFKLYARKAQYLVQIKNYNEAIINYNMSKHSVTDSSSMKTGEKNKWADEIQIKIETCKEKLHTEPISVENLSLFEVKTPPELSYGPNCELEGASDCVTMEYDPECGRHIVATKDIKPGDVLISNKPYVVYLEPEYRFTHCANCLQRSLTLLPCTDCTWVMYCSLECLEENRENHLKLECKNLKHIHAFGLPMYCCMALRVAVKVGIPALENQYKIFKESKIENPRNQGFTDKRYLSDLNAVFNLSSNSKLRAKAEAVLIGCEAWKLVDILGDAIPDPKSFRVIMLHLMQCILNNVTPVSEIHKTSNTDLDIGNALCPLDSILNHSCHHNAKIVSYGKSRVVHSFLPIQKGSQVFINYGPFYVNDKNEVRQTKLKTRFHFTCKCKACTEGDWPTFYSLTMPDLPTYLPNRDFQLIRTASSKVKDLFVGKWTVKTKDEAERVAEFVGLCVKLGGEKCRIYMLLMTGYMYYLVHQGNTYDEA